MHKDVDAADRMIARFSELLRYALESTKEHEVPLHQEIDFLKRYLDIEKTRFGKRLDMEFRIGDDTLKAFVPNLVLQPIVENAIQHGVEPHSKPGKIEMRAEKKNGHLILTIADNGAGLKDPKSVEGGVGLSNTRSRLQQIYQEDHTVEFINRPNGGLEVKVTIPFRETLTVE
jgi:LytS/YehU family sensor histidine kinase